MRTGKPRKPCRCAKKTRGFIEAGDVDPKNLLFTLDRICEVREAVPKAYETIKTLDDQCADIYRGHPFYKPPDLGQRLWQLVESVISDEQPTCPDKAFAGFDK